ncbi:hypothetical protein [Streptomyces sp. NPDC048340]|uniref:hypothetical protein n=1 Tax=Streptomyces sp. NPDC048340 TaxID=3365537 RepID=UPI00370FB98C
MTGPALTTGSGRRSAVRTAPWVRTRLRSAPVSALLAAALAFVTVFLAAALPRAVDRGADQALRSFLNHQGPGPTSLLATAGARYGKETPQELDEVLTTLIAHTGPGFSVVASDAVHGSLGTKPRTLANPELARPDEIPPLLRLAHLRQAGAHTSLVAGQWPGAPADKDAPLPVALSQSAAQTLNARVGMVLEAFPDLGIAQRAEVVGLYKVTDEAEAFWADMPCLASACLAYNNKGKAYWQTSGLVGADSLGRMSTWGQGSEDFWRLPVDTGKLRADSLSAGAKDISSYVAGPTASKLTWTISRMDLRITSRLPQLITEVQARQQAAAPLGAIGPAGVAGVALVVFCLAAALTGDRREAEILLLRARGGSRRGILGRLLGEGAVTVLPAAALATAAAVLLLPTPRLAGTLYAAAAAALFALLAFPLRAAVLLCAPRGPVARRRLVGEVLVVAATVAAVLEVRRRGVAPAGEGLDPLLVAAPLLIALCGGLLLARVQPALIGVLARAARRRAGLVGFLGLARAARTSGGRGGPSVLPLVALLLAVTTGGFGATVLASVDDSRVRVARQTVGGDAQLAVARGQELPEALMKAADALPGVRGVRVWSDADAFLFGSVQGSPRVTVVVAEPEAYAELARYVGRGRFDPALLSAGPPGPDEPVPALFSSDLTGRAADGSYRLRLGNGGELRAKPVGSFDGTPALPGEAHGTVILPAGPTLAHVPQVARPNQWFGIGKVEGARLQALVRDAVPAAAVDGYAVRTGQEVASALAADPLQRAAARLFWVSVAGAAGFALLAVLLTLVRAAPERAALLARLRTMGLRPRQGFLLILAEALPQALAAAFGGALAAAAAVALLGPAIDLTTLVGSPVPTGLPLAAGPVLAQALGLAGLVAVAVLAEAVVTGRRQITTELRAGDQS